MTIPAQLVPFEQPPPSGAVAAELVADGFVTVAEAAAFLGISRSKLYEVMDAGQLVYGKVGRSRRIPRRALTKFATGMLRGGWAADDGETGAPDSRSGGHSQPLE